eukprot:8749515-Heterocapsa_arctica.AAC.1
MDQNHYAPQLRPTDFTALKNMKNEELVDIEFQGALRSMLGGLAWLVPTRPDILVLVGRRQRHGQAPRVIDLIDINKLL